MDLEAYSSLIHDLLDYLQEQTPTFWLAKEQEALLFKEEEKTKAAINFAIPDIKKKENSKTYSEEKKEAPLLEKEDMLPQKKEVTQIKKDIYLDMAPHFSSRLKDIKLIKEIPSDSLAKRRAKLWKRPKLDTEVVVFSASLEAKEILFLENLACSIHLRLKPCKRIALSDIESVLEFKELLEREPCTLIIADPLCLKNGNFLRWVKKNPSIQKQYLHHHPLLILEPLISYFHEGMKKKNLWETLCQLLTIP